MATESKRKLTTAWDIVIAVFFVALATVVFLLFLFGSSGKTVVIKSGGKEFGRYSLSEDKRVVIENGFGKNTVVIEDGRVRVESADCRDLICVHHSSISREGEAIVCLPHELIIEVRGEKDG